MRRDRLLISKRRREDSDEEGTHARDVSAGKQGVPSTCWRRSAWHRASIAPTSRSSGLEKCKSRVREEETRKKIISVGCLSQSVLLRPRTVLPTLKRDEIRQGKRSVVDPAPSGVRRTAPWPIGLRCHCHSRIETVVLLSPPAPSLPQSRWTWAAEREKGDKAQRTNPDGSDQAPSLHI